LKKSNGIQIEFPSDQLHNLHIITLCATDINVISMPKTKSEVPIEFTIPIQILSEISEGQLVSRAISL